MDVLLIEDVEVYEIDVLDGGMVVWIISGLISLSYIYFVGDQIVDFGSF